MNDLMPAGETLQIRATLDSEFALNDRVTIDGGADLVGTVTGISWRYGEGPQFEVGWMHNGVAQSSWFPPCRLALVP